ncbi:hypothetical protein BRD15_00975 [Halobacteriales archaeon SW_6_65_15]|nr:MAG: hypothetical protein BRD15_00975 [Halobacteriales archaeon SW_6_65_15]
MFVSDTNFGGLLFDVHAYGRKVLLGTESGRAVSVCFVGHRFEGEFVLILGSDNSVVSCPNRFVIGNICSLAPVLR